MWHIKKDCFEIHVDFIHIGGEVTTSKVICSSEEDMMQKLRILDYLELAISKFYDQYTEKVIDYIQEKTHFKKEAYQFLMSLVRTDCRVEDFMAKVYAIKAIKIDDGKIYEWRQ